MEAPRTADLADLGRLSALGNPVRRRLYEHVADAGRTVGRDEAAQAVGVGRSLAAYHLDKLVEHGLLEASYARRPGRSGPGAGRPAKLYRRAPCEFVLRAPPRDYRLLGDLLVRVADDDRSGAVRARLERAAHELGRDAGLDARRGSAADPQRVGETLRRRGYEPYESEPGILRLRNCPFEAIAVEHPEIVCALNLSLLEGLIDALGVPARAELAPDEGHCCVAITAPTP